uniref:Peptidase M12B domain-containing protein n=1 Tax=Panagrolaimus sp. PS1159 TaxID=55785 RepID=A0AC35G3W0_9BILA
MVNLIILFLHYTISVVVWHSSAVTGLHHKLTKRELIYTFGVEHKSLVPEYTLIRTRRETGPNGRLKKINFDAWNSTYEIELIPNNKLISPNLISVIHDKNGTIINTKGLPADIKTNCHYHGSVKSHDNVKAAISHCNNLMGVIVMDNHFLMLQTIPERLKHEQEDHHLVYKRDAALINPLEHFSFSEEPVRVELNEDDSAEFCDVELSLNAIVDPANYSIPSEAKLDSLFIFPQHDPITLEIGLFLDSKLYEHFEREFSKSADQHLTDFALALINNVHVLYQQPTLSPNLDVVIVRFEMWKKQPPPLETTIHKNGQAQTLLDSFCRYQARINPGTDLSDPGHWDHGVLLTGYDIYHTTTSVAGVAPVARMCDELFACSLVEGLHLGRSFVLAHEMGHNMGMVHDGVQNQCGRSCCLMSAVNGAGKTSWSTCSVREFNAFLLQLDQSGRGNCLRDPAFSINSHDHMSDGRLPGQRFTADQQCSYFWGRDYQVEIPVGRNMDDICRILWCGNSGSTISTAHPALEGSFCGSQKWCQEGRCEPWRQPSFPTPKVVHGGWSEWTSAQKACPITPCQISGSISMKAQLRTCTEPAPNNGGHPCQGSNIRGIVCGEVASSCQALSRQEFGDRLCTAIRNDPTRPDRQLSGASFLHQTQPCKIWCHVSDSELIRNKGQFPNGSPCGIGQYCVSGACLSLSCNNKAVVAQPKDCPSVKEKQPALKWDTWTTWDQCPVTCLKLGDKPLQKRHRKCMAPSSECPGKSEDTRPCSPMPPRCEEYSDWSEWSECSRTCGGGKSTRRRDCLSGSNCSHILAESKSCAEEQCPEWSTWEEWSPCSASCGTGQKTRTRTCSKEGGCEGELRQITVCTEQKCVEETWSEWLACSVTCGIGFQLRERLCNGILCAENSKQARTCNVQDCENSSSSSGHLWDHWSPWGSCSATCGEGIQTRTRKCLSGDNCPVIESTIDEKRCVLGPCPTWSPWSEWEGGACDSCSAFELRSRDRQCRINFLAGVEGQPIDAEKCGGGDKLDVKNCEEICKMNELKTQPEASEKNPPPVTSELLNTPSSIGNWEEWQEWLPCSVSCGGGIRERIRLCPEGKVCSSKGLGFELEECNRESCDSVKANQWTIWSEWSPCTVACGGGRQFRQRKCRALFVFLCDGPSKEERPCNTDACGSPIFPPKLILAQDDMEPYWSSWSDWSKCSCFTLTQFRRRFCTIRDPTVQGFCPGSIIDQRQCDPNDCQAEAGNWSPWSDWSSCSKDCGSSGHQIRNRMCSNPLPSNRGSYCLGYSFDQRSCQPASPVCYAQPVDGGWTEWTSWSDCSNPCENGQRSRTRYCLNPRPANGGKQCIGSDFELKSCSDPTKCGKSINGGWAEWSAFSSCTAKCGISHRNRSRTCSSPKPLNGGKGCKGLAYVTSICKTELCPNSIDGHWGVWSEWTPCIGCLGTGTRTRTRLCSTPSRGGLPCFGRSHESAPCQPDFAFDDNNFCGNIIRHENTLENAFMTKLIR